MKENLDKIIESLKEARGTCGFDNRTWTTEFKENHETLAIDFAISRLTEELRSGVKHVGGWIESKDLTPDIDQIVWIYPLEEGYNEVQLARYIGGDWYDCGCYPVHRADFTHWALVHIPSPPKEY